MAKTFPIGDRYFSSVMAQTYPNRRFLIAGTALGDVSTNGSGISQTDAPNGTIFDRLDAHGISWKNYYPDVPSVALFFPEYTNNQKNGKVVHFEQFYKDAASGSLPAVSLVDPYVNFSEENGDISIGEAYAASIIDAVLQSPAWHKTALIWTYDEHGGWYDHVSPVPAVRPDNVPPEITVPPDQPGAYDYTGFRVPCAVVSPWAKRNHVSHVVYDHTSILKFIEAKWNLPALTYRDANAHNMLDFFDFKATRPPFADPPTLAKPLNPFTTTPPAGSTPASNFRPIATPVPGDSPASAHLTTLPAGTKALLAAHRKKYAYP
jgi:phospholipase C